MVGPLTKIEGRVLGTLIEKENLMPAAYPITIKRVHLGAIQISNRNPRMFITEPEIQEALDSLQSYNLVEAISGKHVMRYAHNLSWLKIPNLAIPLMGTLLLRGPLTSGELRLYTRRVHQYPSNEMINGFMRSLTAKFREEPLVKQLPMSGDVHPRWAQLFTGPIAIKDGEPVNIEAMRNEITDLQNRLTFLETRLGIRSRLE